MKQKSEAACCLKFLSFDDEIMSEADETKTVLVTGGTGYIGGKLVPILIEQGYRVRCLARNPESIVKLGWRDVEIVQGDALRYETLVSAMKGVCVAYYLIHSMESGEADFEEKDKQAAENFGRAAKQAGVERIIYLGGLGSHSETLSPHLESRQKTGRVLRESGVPVTEFRAGVIIGSGSLSFELIRYLTERLPLMICPKWVVTKAQPIAVNDVLRYLSEAVRVPESQGKIIEIGGPQVFSYREMILGYAKVRGLRRWLINVPLLTPRLSSYWVGFVTPLESGVARLLIEGLKNEVIVRDKTAADIFSFSPKSYELALNEAFDRNPEREVPTKTAWAGILSSPPKLVGNLDVEFAEKEGIFIQHRKVEAAASAESAFYVITHLGGENGWLYADPLWRLRGWMDRLLGGNGLNRPRRSPDELIEEDILDWWRVEAIKPNQLLRLRAEMKLPGRGWLQFEIQTQLPKRVLLIQTAFFEPKGLFGNLYWWLLIPFHFFLFKGMIGELAKKAEEREVQNPSLVPTGLKFGEQ